MTYIAKKLNLITMYQLLIYGLSILAALSLIFSATGYLTLSFSSLIYSLALLLLVCYLTNSLLARAWHVIPARGSWLITALILYCIMAPSTSVKIAFASALAGVLAMASKYIIARNQRHLLNPAAVGAVAVSLMGLTATTWWIGSQVMVPYVIILALTVVYKLRHTALFVTFVLVSVAITLLVTDRNVTTLGDALHVLIISSPLFFLGGVMLTEPTTLPVQKSMQLVYAGLVGLLFTIHVRIFGTFLAPAIALLLGNVFSYALNPKQNVTLTLKKITEVAPDIFRLTFSPHKKLIFKAGQYMQWTLASKDNDGHGNRRTFTIASSPTDDEIVLGIKTGVPRSSFKKALLGLNTGDVIQGGYVAGEFTLPFNAKQPLVFLAGGIGITPFISMLRYLMATNDKRPVTLYYFLTATTQVFDQATLDLAAEHGIVTKLVVGSRTEQLQHATTLGIAKHPNATFYISGPPAMVETFTGYLHEQGIKRSAIKTDTFTGY
ncbi:MAG: hypothetical protein JWM81_48 [Candidatus Saccharibacteria bacterium]|nr:hypothetical protein [Candidatus Saccharibacteria bacterium]